MESMKSCCFRLSDLRASWLTVRFLVRRQSAGEEPDREEALNAMEAFSGTLKSSGEET